MAVLLSKRQIHTRSRAEPCSARNLQRINGAESISGGVRVSGDGSGDRRRERTSDQDRSTVSRQQYGALASAGDAAGNISEKRSGRQSAHRGKPAGL